MFTRLTTYKKTIIALTIVAFLSLSLVQGQPVKISLLKVKAPFNNPDIKVPDFSKCTKLDITDFGAVKGDKEKTSQAIAKAIDKANKVGGGVVVIPEGEWLTGKIHFKNNVKLHLNKGALLLFSENPVDYLPAVSSSWEGMECYNYSPLIYAYECKNIAITGEGEIKAKMNVWEKWFARPKAVLGVETDVLYQWRDLVPTVERRLIPIKDIFMDNIVVSDVKFVSRILGQKELPVENVTLKNITTGTVQEKKHIHENVINFTSSN